MTVEHHLIGALRTDDPLRRVAKLNEVYVEANALKTRIANARALACAEASAAGASYTDIGTALGATKAFAHQLAQHGRSFPRPPEAPEAAEG